MRVSSHFSSLRSRLFVLLLLPVIGTGTFAGMWAFHEWRAYRTAQESQRLESALIDTSFLLTGSDLQEMIVSEVNTRGWGRVAPTTQLRERVNATLTETHQELRQRVAHLGTVRMNGSAQSLQVERVIRAFSAMEDRLGITGDESPRIPTSPQAAAVIAGFGREVSDALSILATNAGRETAKDAGAIVALTEIQRHELEEGRVTVLAAARARSATAARHEREETDTAIRLSLLPSDALSQLLEWESTPDGTAWRQLQDETWVGTVGAATAEARRIFRARRDATNDVQTQVTADLRAQSRESEIRAVWRFAGALAMSAAVILMTLVLGWIAVRRPLSRLRHLEEHARRIGAGEFDLPPLAATGADETALLAQAFDEISDVLRVAKGQLDQLASGEELSDVGGRHVPGPIGEAITGSIDRLTRITRELRSSEELARLTVASAVEAIWMIDHEARITSANASAQSMAGRHRDTMIGASIDDIIVLEDPEPIWNAAHRQMTDAECTITSWSGTIIEAVVSTRSVIGVDGALYTVVFVRDMSERKRFEQQLEWESSHDPLTGLLNRVALSRWVADADGELTVLFVDLDRFKTINDALGHRLGDSLLRQVAARLCAKVREEDLVARLGGDEFVIVYRGDADIDPMQFADRLIAAIEAPFNLGGTVVHVSASVGIVHSGIGADLSELVRRADIAMCRAKQFGRAKVVTFDDSMQGWAERRMEIEEGLRVALAEGQLWPAFQPIVSVEDEELHGIELLARWRHPESGEIPPSEFIPVAEESGLIIDVGRWALREAASAALDLRRINPAFDAPIAVNISGAHLMRGDVVGDLLATMHATGVEARWLTLEVTETWLLDEADHTIDTLRRLTELGVGLSIDDFGTGYSSLTYLRRIPAATVKVDRSYVLDVDDDATDIPIVRLVTSLAHELGMTVIAEGVETPHQQALLLAAGCDFCQGYKIARPMPIDALAGWMVGRLRDLPVVSRP